MLKPIPVKISQSNYAAEKGKEKKYVKKSIQVSSQKMIPDNTPSQLFLVDGKHLEFSRLLDSLFRAEIASNADFKRAVKSRLTPEQIKLLSEVSKDVQ